jgi:hypothetical protein
MPAPERYTNRQKRTWERLVRELKEQYVSGKATSASPYATATAIMDKKIAEQRAKRGNS